MPDLGQVSEYVAHPSMSDRCHVLHERVLGSYQAKGTHHLPPESRIGPGQAGASTGVGNIRAWESASDDVNGFQRVFISDVCIPFDPRPMLGKHGAGVLGVFDLPTASQARTFQP